MAEEAAEESTGADVDSVRRAVYDVSLEAYAVLGTATMQVSQLLRMGRGAVVELDKVVGDVIDIRINDQLVARGEVKVVDDRIAVEITEILRRGG